MSGTTGPLEPITVTAPALSRRPIMRQKWQDVSFLHWRVDPDRVAPLLPAGTAPDCFDGATWVGLIAFRMVDAGAGRGPGVPWLGTFPEVNVRLYSTDAKGRRGVVFRSLETSRLPIVLGSRALFGVPYCWSRMRIDRTAGALDSTTVRRWPGPRGTRARIVVRPSDELVTGDALADFLTARWGLHTRWAGRTLFIPNEHESWPLQHASLEHLDDELLAAAGLPDVTKGSPESVLWSAGVHTVFGVPFRA